MNRPRVSVNAIKNVIISVLVALAFFLGGKTGLFGEIFAAVNVPGAMGGIFSGGAGGEKGADTDDLIVQAALPFTISVNTGDTGGTSRYGVKYDGSALVTTYGRYSATLGEALGSSGEPGSVTRGQWEAALERSGVYFDYLNDQPLDALAQWLGTDISGQLAGHFARRVCLSLEGESLALYYSTSSGNYYRCTTALSSSYILQRIEEFQPNGSYFAYEKDGYENLDPDTLFVGGIPVMNTLTVRNPLGKTISGEDLLEAFSMNSYVATPYSEVDGTTVYVEGNATLRLAPGGEVSFRDSSGEGITVTYAGDAPTVTEVIESARRLVHRGAGAVCEQAELWLTGIEESAEAGGYVVSFGYVVDGVPIYISGSGVAAEVTVKGGYITAVSMILREYAFSGETASPQPLPEDQAAATVLVRGGEPLLVYGESGGAAQPQWIINKHGGDNG